MRGHDALHKHYGVSSGLNDEPREIYHRAGPEFEDNLPKTPAITLQYNHYKGDLTRWNAGVWLCACGADLRLVQLWAGSYLKCTDRVWNKASGKSEPRTKEDEKCGHVYASTKGLVSRPMPALTSAEMIRAFNVRRKKDGR